MVEQNQSQRQAWEAEMFRLLAENVLDYAVFIVDPQRHILSWTKGAERLLGYPEAEIVGQQCDRFFTPEDIQRGIPQKELNQALTTGRGDDDRWHMRKDGSLFWSSGVVTPLKDEAGQLRGFAKIMRDRTDLKRAEEAARERERQLQLLTDRAPVLIAHCDSNRRYKFVNKPYAARFNLHPREIAGKYIRDILGPSAYAAIAGYVDAVLAGERAEFELEIPYDGQGPQIMQCAYDPEWDDEGNIEGFVAAIVNVTESRRAEAALATSQQRLLEAQRIAGLGSWEIDWVTKAVRWSDEMYRLLGVDSKTFQPSIESFLSVVPVEDHSAIERAVEDALAGHAPYRVDHRIIRADGTVRVVSEQAEFTFGPDGQPARLAGTMLDITERRTATKALQESEGRLRAIFDQTVAGVAQTDLTGQFVFVNQRFCEMVHRSSAELYKLRTQDITHPDDLPHNTKLFEQMTRDGQPFVIEKRYSLPNGSHVWVHNSVSLVRGADGQSRYTVAIALDVTQQRRVEEQFRAFLDHSPGALFVKDAAGRYTLASRGFEAALGRPAGEILGKTDEDLFPPGPARLFQDEDRQVREGMQPHTFEETFEFGGRQSTFLSIKFPFPDGSVGCVTADITDRKAMEEALKEADRRKDEFLATLAHELRNPLAPLRNGLQVMRLARHDAAAIEHAQGMMERQLGQMVRLIDDLLDMSRITRGKLQLRRERVDLAAAIQSAIEGSRPIIDPAGHSLTVSLPPDPVYLDADPARLAQVFANLLTNAAKYTDKGGRIGLTATQHGGEVTIAVRDTGIGIAPEHLPRIFEMFSQVDTALERSQGGLGIGLALVRGLVEMHGGTIEARSEGLGKGSEFIVRLPMAESPAAQRTRESGSGEKAPSQSRKRILVADDLRDAADSLAMVLRLEGHDVHTVNDGQAAVEAAQWFRPDLVLLDIGMPRLNGFEACRRIRELPGSKQIVIVATTGWGQDEDKKRAADAGFDEHLTKPVDPAALNRLLARLAR